jgi:hypothetical protein
MKNQPTLFEQQRNDQAEKVKKLSKQIKFDTDGYFHKENPQLHQTNDPHSQSDDPHAGIAQRVLESDVQPGLH